MTFRTVAIFLLLGFVMTSVSAVRLEASWKHQSSFDKAITNLYTRQKRDANYGHCPSSSVMGNPLVHAHTLDTDAYNVIYMVWTGMQNENRVIGLMSSSSSYTTPPPSKIYLSEHTKNANEEYSFSEVKTLANFTLSNLEVNPKDRSHVLLIGEQDDQYRTCVSVDAGKTYKCSVMLDGYRSSGSFVFEGSNILSIMSSMYTYNEQALVLSKDYGVTWTKVADSVNTATFMPGNPSMIYADIASSRSWWDYYSDESSSADMTLKTFDVSDLKNIRSNYLSGLKTTPIYGFEYVDRFLHIVTDSDDGEGRVLKVSRDHGETFNQTYIPTLESEQHITLLDKDDGLIFAHVSDSLDGSYGSLYTSGLGGYMYTLSLERHIASDFYKVLSMDGVFLTTQKQQDGSLKTLITRDRGGLWEPISVRNCGHSSCNIQVYNSYIITQHSYMNNNPLASLPTSSASARGLIVVHGMFGDSIKYSDIDYEYKYENPTIFISANGGETWSVADEGILKGAHHILISDSGSSLQAVPMDKKLDNFYFSFDEGACWHIYNMSQPTLNDNFIVKALVSQPGDKSLQFSIIGYNSVGANITWTVVDIDFTNLAGRQCKPSDYDHLVTDCYLGEKLHYNKVKASSWCYCGNDFNQEIKTEQCVCTRADFECDYGFTRADDSGNTCKENAEFKQSGVTFCFEHFLFMERSSGYRRIPGDNCTMAGASLSFSDHVVYQNLSKSCEGEASTYLDLESMSRKMCSSSAASASRVDQQATSTGLVAGVSVLFILMFLFFVAFVVFYYKYKKLLRKYEFSNFESSTWRRDGTTPANEATSGVPQPREADTDASNGRSYLRLEEDDVNILPF